jgi:heme iron utilization protein
MIRKYSESQLRELFQHQKLGVLATSDGLQPYTSLVAFAVSEDLSRLIFLTSRDTRKFRNIMACSSVSMLVDNRTNQAADFQNALAVTIIGRAVEQQGRKKAGLLELFLVKHPELESFANMPSSAVLEIRIERYLLVSRFEETQQLEMPTLPESSAE